MADKYPPLVERIARTIRRPSWIDLDDILSVGYQGYLDAKSRYDEGKGDFEAFAVKRVKGAIRDHLRKAVPKGNDGYMQQVNIDDISIPVSINLAERMERDADRQLLFEYIDRLPRRERILFYLHYGLGMPLKEMAGYAHLTPARMSQVHRQGLNRLIGMMREDDE